MENNKFYELTVDETMDVDGGIAPIIIAGGKILLTGVLAGAGWRAGEAIYDTVKSWF